MGMRTLGLIHRVETNGAVTSMTVEADSAEPAFDVFRSAFGPELTHQDLVTGNRLEDHRLESISWGHWQRLNPITIVGANSLRTTGTPVPTPHGRPYPSWQAPTPASL